LESKKKSFESARQIVRISLIPMTSHPQQEN